MLTRTHWQPARLPAARAQVTDLAGTLNFIVLAVMTLLLAGSYTARQIVVTVLVCVWGLRLGAYLVNRVFKVRRRVRARASSGH